MLIGAGLPFREDDVVQDQPAPAASTPAPMLRAAALAGVMSLVLFCLPSFASTLLVRSSTPALPADAAFDRLVGCIPLTGSPAQQAGSLVWRYSCPVSAGPVDHLVLQVNLLSPRASPGMILRLRRAATGEQGAEDVTSHVVGDSGWTEVETIDPDRMAAYAAWIDGVAARGGWDQRVRAALASLNPSGHPPVVITLTSPAEISHLSPQDRRLLQSGLAGVINLNHGMSDLARRIAAAH